MKNLSRWILLCACAAILPASGAIAPADLEFFEKQIRPILAENCLECHSGQKPKGGLRLDSRPSWQRGGESGPVIVVGNPEASRLIRAIRHSDQKLQMPPKRKLPEAEIARLVEWIRRGAPDPREAPAVAIASGFNLEERRKHWAFQPVQNPAPPIVKESRWAGHPVDRFIRARQIEKGMSPAAPADKHTLIRRVSFTITGLPPTPAEVDAFITDNSPDAYLKLVNRLLGSSQFGERWARHWMDLVRYAETHGSEGDPEIPRAWLYRDYLIRAFNADLPYDQLVREHIAGDLLPRPRLNADEQLNESILGTAHLRFVEHGYQPVDSTEDQVNAVENQIDVFGKTFQGLTIACARCHDHKFDAITQRDYYALYGIFASSRPGQVTVDSPERLNRYRDELLRLKASIKAQLAKDWMHAADAIPALLRTPKNIAVDPLARRVAQIVVELEQIEKPAREKILRDAGKQIPGPLPPAPFARWNFEGNGRDQFGALNAELKGDAKIVSGRLVLNGTASARTPALTRELRAKTLEVWLVLPTLAQRSGGAITVESGNGAVFDSIVFAEREKNKWIAGSDLFRRTRDFDGVEETSRPGELLHMAAVYEADGSIALYRNGVLYGKPYIVTPAQTFAAGNTHVMFGLRHTGSGGYLRAEIEEARLYDRPLTAAEIATSNQLGVGLVTAADLAKQLTVEQRERHAGLQSELEKLRARLAAEASGDSSNWQKEIRAAHADRAHPLHAWAWLNPQPDTMEKGWRGISDYWQTELARRQSHNRDSGRTEWDVAGQSFSNWFASGNGITRAAPGEFAIEVTGDRVLNGILPAGVYSHLLSQKHSGVLLSPRFKLEDSVNVRMLGSLGGGVRVIVDNYPLGDNGTYPKHRPTSDQLAWTRFDTTYRKGSWAYIEFSTNDDNTHPARSSASGQNAARSSFGAAQVAFGAVPLEEIVPILALLESAPPKDAAALAQQIAATLKNAVAAWRDNRLTEAQRSFLDAFVRKGLLPVTLAELPAVAPLVAEFRRVEESLPAPRRAPGMMEARGFDQPLMVRGNHAMQTAAVPRRYLEALGSSPCASLQSGRLELSAAITRVDNPLTARVMVNRVWQHLFGRGIVLTVDNFGRLGELPTHPELLDHLATQFVAEGWSIKKLIRTLVMSQTYQLASEPPPRTRELDPTNELLTHARVRRLEAEAIRDSMLAVSGKLDWAQFGPPAGGNSVPRRSIYLSVRRTSLNPFLEIFDAPKPFTTLGRRDTTNVPAQSLSLLNDPFVIGLSKDWAAKLMSTAPNANSPNRVKDMFAAAFARPPSPDELAKSAAFLVALAREANLPVEQIATSEGVWQDFAQSLFNLKEFMYVR